METSVEILYQQLLSAVQAELDTVQSDRSHLKTLNALWAERLSVTEAGALYRFELSRQAGSGLQDVPVMVDTGESQAPGSIVSADGYTAIVMTQDLGEQVAASQLLVDLTFILNGLLELLESHATSGTGADMVANLFGLSTAEQSPAAPDPPSGREVALHIGDAPEQPNDDQWKAISESVRRAVTFIWGPPGTGKTTTLGWIAADCLAAGESVLLVSNTNVAVDRAFRRVLDALPRGASTQQLLRLGLCDDAGLLPYCPDMEIQGRTGTLAARAKRVKEASLCACTLAKGVIDKMLQDRVFDVVLLDEVSMAPLPFVAAIAAMAQRRLVVCGDFRQLPPIAAATDETASRLLTTDVFRYAGIVYRDGSVAQREDLQLLREQRRMLAPICELVNRPMYGGALVTPRSLRATPQECLHVVDIAPLHAVSDRTSGYSHFSIASALVTSGLVADLLDQDPTRRIGVVTPYAAQASILHAVLNALVGRSSVRVGTVHRFQGEERDTIVFDATDGPPFTSPGRFLMGRNAEDEGARLLNVAVTRARRDLFVVADLRYLGARLPLNGLTRHVMKQLWDTGNRWDASRLLTRTAQASGLRLLSEDEAISHLLEMIANAERWRQPLVIGSGLLTLPAVDEALRSLLSHHGDLTILDTRAAAASVITEWESLGAIAVRHDLPRGRYDSMDRWIASGREHLLWGDLTLPCAPGLYVSLEGRHLVSELMLLRRASRRSRGGSA